LKDALAAYVDLPPGYALMLGNGSDELIALLALVCAKPGARVLAPEPGFVMYAMSAQLQGLGYTGVPLTADFEIDESAMADAIAREQPALVYLAYPNNPTATVHSKADVTSFIESLNRVSKNHSTRRARPLRARGFRVARAVAGPPGAG
jgi:histidinol-phosphate aminotransferase